MYTAINGKGYQSALTEAMVCSVAAGTTGTIGSFVLIVG